MSKIWTFISTNYIFPTLGATMGVLPLLLFFMGRINILGLLANMLVTPIVPFVMVYGLLTSCVGYLFPSIHTTRFGSLYTRIGTRVIDYVYLIGDMTITYGITIEILSQWGKRVVLFAGIVRYGRIIMKKQ